MKTLDLLDSLARTGVLTSLRRLFAKIRVNERNRDFSPTMPFKALQLHTFH